MRYSNETLRGLLLEEAILYILSRSGYVPILNAGTDVTLFDGRAGLEVRGRGAWHQIDAVADFSLVPPFSNPQRLLLEAKFRNSKTGIEIIRNATGVHKDVSENWVVDPAAGRNSTPRKRYHYLYAVFSKEPFSKPAQDYAYAQDIYLLPLKRSAYFQPIIEAIDNVSFDGADKPSLKEVREFIRSQLIDMHEDMPIGNNQYFNSLLEFINVCHQSGYGFMTMFDGRFPVFLSAEQSLDELDIRPVNRVRIRVQDGNWFIEDRNGRWLFSFDLPEEIFKKYEESGSLTRRSLVRIKQEFMSDFYAYQVRDGRIRLIQFVIDQRWFDQVKENLGMQ
ncbi:MAG: hypothetical protein ABW152_16640 [Candidatus Thiodiazotropha endolucinida]